MPQLKMELFDLRDICHILGFSFISVETRLNYDRNKGHWNANFSWQYFVKIYWEKFTSKSHKQHSVFLQHVFAQLSGDRIICFKLLVGNKKNKV
jgi:hypothetical protein